MEQNNSVEISHVLVCLQSWIVQACQITMLVTFIEVYGSTNVYNKASLGPQRYISVALVYKISMLQITTNKFHVIGNFNEVQSV